MNIQIEKGGRLTVAARFIGKLAREDRFRLPMPIPPAWVTLGTMRMAGGRVIWCGDNPATNSFADLWPHPYGSPPPCRPGACLYIPAGKCTVHTCQALFDGGMEITYRYEDGSLSLPCDVRRPRKPGKQFTFVGRAMARLILKVTSVEPVQAENGDGHEWLVRYHVQLFNQQQQQRT